MLRFIPGGHIVVADRKLKRDRVIAEIYLEFKVESDSDSRYILPGGRKARLRSSATSELGPLRWRFRGVALLSDDEAGHE
jgi:hypothetical protein